MMTTHEIPVITIDGLSGSGKGTIGQLLAENLSWHFLDSGAIYRILALELLTHKVSITDLAAVTRIANNLNIKFIPNPGSPPKIILNGVEVTTLIRSSECGNLASKIAAISGVRALLLESQRAFCKLPGLAADGRDMGTVVFPYAQLKIFLVADLNIRGERRLQQLQAQGINATLSNVLQDLAARDGRDSDRVCSPLKPDPAAVIVDTTKLKIDEVLQQILAHVNNMHF